MIKNSYFVENYLRRALEAAFDIGRHVLAKSFDSKELEYKRYRDLRTFR